MFLTRIELQGFKSFAEKTIIELLDGKGSSHRHITAIVGPNGSGKSNIADAVRWVLGEQSTKAVRGGKSEDVIFFGSQNRNRASMAEVSLLFNNGDGAIPLERPEIKISRRLYRDGASEYLLNNAASRLIDIQLLLARANFGKESYLIIAQGMIDHLLLMGGAERKTFFDEATGVHHLQIKKDQAIKKLLTTAENLKQAKLLQEEITPRLRSLSRQVRRLEERENIEKELFELQKEYFSNLWQGLEKEKNQLLDELRKLEEGLRSKNKEMKKSEEGWRGLEFEETKSSILFRLQDDYRHLLEQKQALKEKKFNLETQKLNPVAAARPFDFDKIQNELALILKKFEELLKFFSETQSPEEIVSLKEQFNANVQQFKNLLTAFKKPTSDGKNTAELEKIKKNLDILEQKLNQIQTELNGLRKKEESKKSFFLDYQKNFLRQQEERHKLEEQINALKIELAKIDVRETSLKNELAADLKERAEEIKKLQPTISYEEAVNLLPQIQKLKRQIEWIGGIDPEIVKEYEETKSRHDFLQVQSQDLEKSISSLVELANNLEENIQKQFEERFNKINEKFNEHFRLLFNGGQAKIIKMAGEPKDKEEMEEEMATVENGAAPKKEDSILDKLIIGKTCQGVEIHATPPGKKLKNINMLSGGEKALTSIALISAILAVNPPPFIILDEVDAALDENNSLRFARILNELAAKTQLIVISHNRATMQAADFLYGVTMGKDGVSKILSLKLEEAIGQKI